MSETTHGIGEGLTTRVSLSIPEEARQRARQVFDEVVSEEDQWPAAG